MRVYLSRWVCLDVESNLRRLEEEPAVVVDGGCELVFDPLRSPFVTAEVVVPEAPNGPAGASACPSR